LLAAQAAEARATLLAMAAGTQAAEEIAASEAIRSAVSADVIEALITVGLLERQPPTRLLRP
jgi:hypothetical protein